MRISELARLAGLTPRAIRLYEARGLIRPSRTEAGYRQFDEADVRVLVFIRMGRELGLPLAQIADLVPAYRSGRLRLDQLIDGLIQRLAEIDRDIARLRALRRKTVDHIAWARMRQGEQLSSTAMDRKPSGARTRTQARPDGRRGAARGDR